MKQSEYIVQAEVLRKTEWQIFRKMGFSEEGAAMIADSLLEADLRGVSSHGAIRIPVYCDRLEHKVVFPDQPMDVAVDYGAVAVIDGHDTFGQISGTRAMRLAIEKASRYGVGCVGVRHSHHYGTAAYFAQMALEADMIGFSTTNTNPLMPPPGGKKKIVGNNPISYAVPAGRHLPIVLDMACSTVAHGKLQVAAKKGIEIPFGWATDADGHPTTDAAEAMKGFLCPVGGHKGFGLAEIMELLCGPLVGSGFGEEVTGLTGCYERPQNCGHFFAALDVSKFGDRDAFKQRVNRYIDFVKSCPVNEEVSGVYMPGEIEYQTREKRLAEGIPLPAGIAEDLVRLTDSLGIPFDL
jgi:ureidoglycolate dehydrogenase (NAD+)